jgi:hypothetical protein
LTPHLLELLVRLGAWMPFAPAAELLQAFTAVATSPATARRQTEAAGAVLVAQETAAAPALAPPADPGPPTRAHLQVSVDGVMVRLTEGTWVEVRNVAVGEVPAAPVGQEPQRVQTTALSYFSRHANAEEFTRLAVVELHRRGVRAAARVGGVADGALWQQSFYNYHCPAAVRILDFPHALEHVTTCAKAYWGESSPLVAPWLAEQAHLLKTAGPDTLLATLTEWRAAAPTNTALAEAAEYLVKRREQMAYPAFRAAGWPIGSGAVESANKLVVEARLKGAGMGWAAEHLNPMLALRDVVCSDRWAAVWPQIARGLRGAGRPTVQRRPAPASAVKGTAGEQVNAVVVAEVEAILAQVSADVAAERAARAPVNGKPARQHPWRRATLSKGQPSAPAHVEPAKG